MESIKHCSDVPVNVLHGKISIVCPVILENIIHTNREPLEVIDNVSLSFFFFFCFFRVLKMNERNTIHWASGLRLTRRGR